MMDEWLESICFVDEDGKILPVQLTKDESPDPEGDRDPEKTEEEEDDS